MAENPYVNKVEYAGQTLMDLTGDTVNPSDVLNGVSFHDRSGAPQTGNLITHNVYDGLNSTSTSDALSAKQGKVLNDKIEFERVEKMRFTTVDSQNRTLIQWYSSNEQNTVYRLDVRSTTIIFNKSTDGGTNWTTLLDVDDKLTTKEIETNITGVSALKASNVITIIITIGTQLSTTSAAWVNIGTLPIALRPSKAVYFLGYDNDSTANARSKFPIPIRIATTGVISAYLFANEVAKPYGTITYCY